MNQNSNQKWVYLFEDGRGDAKDLLGGKGAGLAEMTRAGLPVPPGFVVTTEACNAFYANSKHSPRNVGAVCRGFTETRRENGQGFGHTVSPLVSVAPAQPFPCPA